MGYRSGRLCTFAAGDRRRRLRPSCQKRRCRR